MNSSNIISESELEQIWKDADFQPREKYIKHSDINRKVKDNLYISNCKICNIEIKLPCTYNGNYPLCAIHRAPNDRLKINYH